MKKSLIAVAVAGLFAAPAAMAEVTISGAINVGIQVGKSSAGSVAANKSLTTNQLGANYSHMDIESVDDIGNGNKVIFHYQFDISGTSSAQVPLAGGAVGNRNSFLGVAGGWGAFKMGTNENVYERFQYVSDPLDGAVGVGGNLNILATPGAGAIFQVGQHSGTPQVDFYRRTEQQVWYESPNWSGFSFEFDYSLSAFKTSSTPTAPGLDPKVISIGGKFQPEGAPFYVDLAFEQHKDMFGLTAITALTPTLTAANGKSSKDNAIEIGGGWMFGDLGLNVRYEMLKYKEDGVTSTAVTEYKRNAEWIGVKYSLPSGYVGAELGIAQKGKTNVGSVDKTGAKMFGVGYFHNLSKQSQLQFIYARTDNDDNATYAQAGAPNGGSPGSKHDVATVTIKHTF